MKCSHNKNQFTNDQLPITDKDFITQKHNNYCKLRGIYRSNMHSARLVIIRINAHRRPLSCSVGLLDVCLLEGFINKWSSRENDQLIIIIGNIEPDVINTLLHNRPNNHLSSSLSKSNMRGPYQKPQLSIGDLVYLHSDKGKTKAHPRYIVTSIHDDWCI